MKKRKFSKIFDATVTFGEEVVVSETKKSVVYARAGESTIVHPDGQVKKRTVMAFGANLDEVKDSVFPGNTVTLAIQYDGGTVNIIGYPREAA